MPHADGSGNHAHHWDTTPLLSYIERDLNPTFVVKSEALSNVPNYSLVFKNQSLITNVELHDRICQLLTENAAPCAALQESQQTFKSWVLSKDARQDAFEFEHILWSANTLVDSVKIVSGIQVPPPKQIFEKTLATGRARMQSLGKIGESIVNAQSASEFYSLFLQALSSLQDSLAFTAIYTEATLGGFNDTAPVTATYHCHGITGHVLVDGVPKEFEADMFRCYRAVRGSSGSVQGTKPALMSSMTKEFKYNNSHEMKKQLDMSSSLVCPFEFGIDHKMYGFLLVGLGSEQDYDDDMQLFARMLAEQLALGLTLSNARDAEKRHLAECARLELKTMSLQLALHEHEAERNTEPFRKFMERTSVGIWNIDVAANKLGFCNDAWRRVHGLSMSDIEVALPWNDVHPDDLERVQQLIHKLETNTGGENTQCEFRILKPWRPSPESPVLLNYRVLQTSAISVVAKDGRVTSIIGTTIDVTHLKWAEKLHADQLAEAIESTRQREQYMDMTSHEIRNPLNGMLHSAQEILYLISEGRLLVPHEQTSTLEQCIENAKTIILCGMHQKRIIDDVLTLSKLDSGMLCISLVDASPVAMVEDLLKIFDTELRSSNVKASLILDPSFLSRSTLGVLIDRYRVLQILINLLSNAIKFTKERALRELKIVISASDERPSDDLATGLKYVPVAHKSSQSLASAEWNADDSFYLHFSVRDSGIGMTDEEACALFNRFMQASPRTHASYGGTGLGLFISKELAELHGGAIGLSTVLGSGSTFDFYVRVRPGTQDIKPAELLISHSVAAGSRRSNDQAGTISIQSNVTQRSPASLDIPANILVLEDNLINQKILDKLLRRQKCNVVIANDGLEGLSMVRSSRRWIDASAEPRASPQHENDMRIDLDLILCDIEMPRLDGHGFVKQLREWEQQGILRPPRIPVIAVTGNARLQQVKAAIQSGFDHVMVKPYQAADLYTQLDTYVFSQKHVQP